MSDPVRKALLDLIEHVEYALTSGDATTELAEAPGIARAALAESVPPLVCALCMFVGDSEDPRPITIMNGQLTCEPHNGYFQGDAHVQAIIAWKRENPEAQG